MKKISTLLLFASLTFLVGCASQITTPVYQAKHLLLLPVQSLHKELQANEAMVNELLYQSLESSRFEVRHLSAKQYKTLHAKALEVSGAIYSPAVGDYTPLNTGLYAKALLAMVHDDWQVDTVIMPKLLLRDAQMQNNKVSFDGVTKPLEYAANTPNTWLPERPRGLSLQLSAYNLDANSIEPVFAGLSLPFIIKQESNKPKYILKTEFFTENEAKKACKMASKKLLQQFVYEKNL